MASFLVVGILLGLLAHGVLTFIVELDGMPVLDSGNHWQWARSIGMTLLVGYNLLAFWLLAWLVLPMVRPPLG